jgi:hypothetical protein
VDDHELTITNLVAHEKYTCHAGMELTFKLIGIAHYERSEETWKNSGGETWSVKRLLTEELKQPISLSSTCGGTHRLFALSYAVNRRRLEGRPIDGPWAVALKRVQAYQSRAYQLQNKDGSFSTAWFERLQQSGDLNRRLMTSGHVAEWLAFSLPSQQLDDDNFEQLMACLVELLTTRPKNNWNWGALTHALHALAIYEQRASESSIDKLRIGMRGIAK